MTRDRTVLFVTSYYLPHVGGVEAYVHGLATALDALPGWRAVIVTTGDEHTVTATDEGGLRVYRLPVQARISYTPLHLRWPAHLRRIISQERPDFINVHTPVPGLADVASHIAGAIPVLVTYHAATLAKPGRPGFNLAARVYALAEARMMRRAHTILGVSDYVAAHLHTRFGGNVSVLENAVDETAVAHLDPSTETQYTAAFMARLDPTHAWKGLDLLLQAVHAHVTRYGPDTRVLVIGDGQARPGYEELARQLGVHRNITFAGSLSGTDKFTALRRCRSLVICPTSANDAFPTVMLEAWASGVPVIATAIGPLPTLVDHQHTGLLVPGHDPDSLATALHLIDTRPGLRRSLARHGRTKVADSHTWQIRARQFAHLLVGTVAPIPDSAGAPAP